MQTEQDLEKLVHTHTAALLRYCTGLLGSEADAQDAVQQTFIKAWQNRHTLRRDGTDNERAWLYRIAYRTALDMLRAARRAAAYPTPEPLEQDPGISEELHSALDTLKPLDRGAGAGACAGWAGLQNAGTDTRKTRRLSAHTL